MLMLASMFFAVVAVFICRRLCCFHRLPAIIVIVTVIVTVIATVIATVIVTVTVAVICYCCCYCRCCCCCYCNVLYLLSVVRAEPALPPAPADRSVDLADATLHKGSAAAQQHLPLHGEHRRAAAAHGEPRKARSIAQ